MDKSTNGLTVSAASSQPTYVTNAANGLGTVAFNGSQGLNAGSVTAGKLLGGSLWTSYSTEFNGIAADSNGNIYIGVNNYDTDETEQLIEKIWALLYDLRMRTRIVPLHKPPCTLDFLQAKSTLEEPLP